MCLVVASDEALSHPLENKAAAACSKSGGGRNNSGLLSQWLIQPFINVSNQLVLEEVSTLLFHGISALPLLLVAKFWEHRSLASFGLWWEKLGKNLLFGAVIGFLTTTAIIGVNALAGQLHFRLGNQFNLALCS